MRKMLFLMAAFCCLTLISPNQVDAATGRTCCKAGSPPYDCNTCDTTKYWKTYDALNDQCQYDTGPCEECGPDKPIGNACDDGVPTPTSPPATTSPVAAPSCTITGAPTSITNFPFMSVPVTATPLVKNGTVSTVAFRSASASVASFNP